MTFRFAPFAAAMLALLTAPLAAEEIMPLTQPVALDEAQPERETVVELAYLGGLVIDPGEAKIGGISGLEWADDKLYAVSDDGRWLIITPDEFDRRLIDLVSIETGPLLDLRGKRIRKKREADAEAITRDANGDWLVAFEHDHRIWRYSALTVKAMETEEPIIDLAFGAAENSGIETLAVTPDGLLACGEWAGTDTPNCMRERGGGLVSFEVNPPETLSGRNAVPTDGACTSGSTCYILFRSYSPDQGNAAAIVELNPANEARTIATLLPPHTLDNFEGLAVREVQGRTYLYLVSDDNFSNRQRTLLMKFELLSARKQVDLPPPATTEVDTAAYETVSVVLETEMGDITIALETERAPITASNFLRYVEEDRFDGTAFYRAMSLDREPRPNGLIQGGTRWDPDRVLPGIAHEPTTQTGLSHTSGAISMAMGDPGTANGDFSIMLQDQTGLDARPEADEAIWQNGYAVFGYVTEGMDVVAAIHAAPTDPDQGDGAMKGQMLAEPVKIIDARLAETPDE